MPRTRSESVSFGGSPNDLEARAVGDRLTFSVNGVELAEVQDDTLPTGGIGVFVGGDHNELLWTALRFGSRTEPGGGVRRR